MSCIKSIEHVSLTLGATTSVHTVNLTKGQVLAQCVPMFFTRSADNSAMTGNLNSGTASQPIIGVTDNAGTTAAYLQRNTATQNNSINGSVYVVEFVDDIEVKKYTWSSIADSVDKTISAVTLANTFLVAPYLSTASAGGPDDNSFNIRFTTTTNVNISRYTTGAGGHGGDIYTVEDKSVGNIHFNVDRGYSWIYSDGTGFITTTIGSLTSRPTDKTFLLTNSSLQIGSPNTGYTFTARIASSTSIELVRRGSSLGTGLAWQRVELKSPSAWVYHSSRVVHNYPTISGNVSIGKTVSPNSMAGSSSGYDFLPSWAYSGTGPSMGNVQKKFVLNAQRDGVDWSSIADSLSTTIDYAHTFQVVDWGVNRRIFIT